MKTITRDVQMLYYSRDIFLRVNQIAEENDRIDKRSLFFGFFASVYIDSVVMGIRRQLKGAPKTTPKSCPQCGHAVPSKRKGRSDKSVSLARLLDEIVENPKLITYADFKELYRNLSPLVRVREARAQEDFSRFADPDDPDHIDVSHVRADVQALKDACAKAETYADKRVAHWDEGTPVDDLRWDDVFKPLDVLGDLVKTYNLLLLGLDVEIHPKPQYPIYHIFEEPWVDPPGSA